MAGVSYHLRCGYTKAYAPQMARITVAPDGTLELTPLTPGISQAGNEVRIALTPGVRVEGRVLAGGPLWGINVRCQEILEQAHVEPDGTFAFERLPAGRYTLELIEQDLGNRRSLATQEIEVPEEGALTGVLFQIE